VTAPGGGQMVLQLAYFDRGRDPVATDIGPVLDLEDVVGGKVCALASRVEPRDYADVAAALERYTPAQLIRFARRLDPGLTGEDFADAGLRLDQMDDRAFAQIGLSHDDVTRLRGRLAAWPRDTRAADRHSQPGSPAGHGPVSGQTPATGRPERGMHEPGPASRRRHELGHEPAGPERRDDPEAEP